MKKYHIWTIGCQMNVADSTHVGAELEKLGYEPTADIDAAEVVVLNTCVVRQSAEDKATGKLGSLKPWRKQNPDRTLALMGCMVGVKPAPALVESLPWVDVFMAPSQAQPLVDHLRNHMIEEELAALERQQLQRRYQYQDDAYPIASIKHLALLGEAPVAAHVPIVYGCSHACTYCVIPYPPRRRTQPPAGRDPRRSARTGRAGREGDHAVGPDRGPLRLRPAGMRRTESAGWTYCAPSTRSRGWSASASSPAIPTG